MAHRARHGSGAATRRLTQLAATRIAGNLVFQRALPAATSTAATNPEVVFARLRVVYEKRPALWSFIRTDMTDARVAGVKVGGHTVSWFANPLPLPS
jgi:hypothetical protein